MTASPTCMRRKMVLAQGGAYSGVTSRGSLILHLQGLSVSHLCESRFAPLITTVYPFCKQVTTFGEDRAWQICA
jgi:hypothetical protein